MSPFGATVAGQAGECCFVPMQTRAAQAQWPGLGRARQHHRGGPGNTAGAGPEAVRRQGGGGVGSVEAHEPTWQ